MPEIGPGPIITIFVVSVTVMVFFTTSAISRVEDLQNPNRKFIVTLSLINSFSLLFWLAWLLVISDQLDGYPALYKSMQVVFAAFIIPGLLLLYDQVDRLEEYYNHPDFSLFWTTVGCAFVAFCYLGIIFASPASV
jgi:uncharacterized membrane protein (DUF4010 family)